MSVAKREPNDDHVVDRIEQTLKQQKKTKKELLTYLGMKDTNFTVWRYGNGKSYLKYLDKIAEFLGGSISYLIEGNQENATALQVTEEEREIIAKYRRLDPIKKTY